MDMINEEVFGSDPKIKKAIKFAKVVSVTKSPVLIVGEFGTGKKTFAKYIHQNSSRSKRPLLVVDCSNRPEEVENQILGHRDEESGRFSKGVLESSSGGTILLSNIDCLEEGFQKKLYKIFLELPDYDLDVRIMGTTTKNLSKLVGTGRFYRALYIFISNTQITLPPLRERLGDIEEISRGILLEMTSSEGPQFDIGEKVIDKLQGHYWANNISELRSVIENSLSRAQNGVIEESDLVIGDMKIINNMYSDEDDGLKLMSLKEAEKLLIRKALIHTSENRTQAAKILGVSIRTLRNKINEYRSEGANYFVNLR